MTDQEREWGERHPVLFTVIASLASASAFAFAWWHHPAALRPESVFLVALMLTLPVINARQTVRKVSALKPGHAACAREMINGALRAATLTLITVGVFTGILLNALK